MTEPKSWSYSAGKRGKNRVRAFEGRSRTLFVEYWERDGEGKLHRCRHSLRHRDRGRAIRQAKSMAARLAVGPESRRGEITLGSLFDIYVAEVTPRKGREKQQHDRRTAEMFLRLWGRDRPAKSLTLRDWEQFIDLRRAGKVAPGSKSTRVGDRQIEYDLKLVSAVFRWASRAGVDGQPLLDRNPLVGYPFPRERSPARPVLTDEQYQALLRVASQINWRFQLALVLANETGHRLSGIRHLRWSDIDLEHGRIRWRAVHDKIGFEHVTPMSSTLHGVLVRARMKTGTIGDAWVLPSTRRPARPCPKGTLDKWFAEAARRAKVELPRGARWHGLRRKFATELKDLPLKDLAYIGGWKDPKTLLECYQQPDEARMRDALALRRPFGQSVVSTRAVSIDTIAKRLG